MTVVAHLAQAQAQAHGCGGSSTKQAPNGVTSIANAVNPVNPTSQRSPGPLPLASQTGIAHTHHNPDHPHN